MRPKQIECLAFIRRHTEETGASPTQKEIQDHLGMKWHSGVQRLLQTLETRGFITMEPGAHRSIKLNEKASLVQIGELAKRLVRAATKTGNGKVILPEEEFDRFIKATREFAA